MAILRLIIPQPFPPELPAGVFAIPSLRWSVAPLGLTLSDLGPFRGMFTLLQNSGFGDQVAAYLPAIQNAQELVSNDINVLEDKLISAISGVIADWPNHPPSNAILTGIAIGIQLWGGRTGRQPFIGRAGFASNFDVSEYRNMINDLMPPPPAGNAGLPFPALQKAVNRWSAKDESGCLVFYGF